MNCKFDMRRFFVFMVFCVLCIGIGAVPAKPGIITLVQSDGTEVKVRLRGDENYHYYETLDGKKIELTVNRQQTTNPSACGSSPNLGEQLGVIVDRQQSTKKRVHPNSQFYRQRLKDLRFSTLNLKRAPHQAERGLVILVEFKDVTFKKTRNNFDDLLNKEGYNYNGATGSARDYFCDASNGQYVPQFDVYGPYKLDRNMSYYGQNDWEGLDKHPDQMVVDAIAKLDAAENINFANYDTDNDGYIDNLFVYYAGYGENEGASENTIWPHAWEVYGEYVDGVLTYDGKKLKGYACTSELQGTSGSTMCGIGTFCHEFSHVLGLPDFYVTDYSSSHKTPGDWDIMDCGSYLNDGNTPPTYSAHERFYLGWLTPEILNEAGDFKLEDIKESNKAYIITSSGTHNLEGGNPNPKTYYLLENRQKTGWDTYLPGHGMMISKTIYDEDKWYNNIPNNSKNSQGYDIIEADGKAPNDTYGKAGDLFPGTSKVTSYTPYAKYPITNIKEVGGVISFSFMGGTSGGNTDTPEEGDDNVILGDCFEETFDGLNANSSTDITSSIDEYADNTGWEGYKLFCSSGMLKVGSSKYAGYVITPMLGIEGDVQVEFVGRGYNEDATISFELDGVVVKEIEVASQNGTYLFELEDLEFNSKITISASINRFYIDNFKVCKKQDVETIIVDETEDLLLINGDERCELVGVNIGDIVSCYDAMGRLLWRSVVDDDRFEFVEPQGFYLLQVTGKNKVCVLKGINE